MVLSATLEGYMKDVISLTVGSAVSPEFMVEKLMQAEECKRSLEAQILSLNHRLVDLQDRLDKSKEESSMNALALKRHVSEMARVEVEARQRCEWLEEECSLYLKDREVFMRAAEEAEERAFAAEKRCAHAHYEVAQLLQQLTTSQTDNTCKIQQLEAENSKLQAEISKAEKQLAESKELQAQTATESDKALMNCDIQKEEYMYKQWVGTQELMAEVNRLWKENSLHKCYLERAKIQIELLTDDNKDLKVALRTRTTSSPVAKKGKASMMSKPQKFFCDIKDPRQPLDLLESNVMDFRRR